MKIKFNPAFSSARRDFLKASAFAPLSLLLRPLSLYADSSATPRNLFVIYTPHGTQYSQYPPTGTRKNFRFDKPILSPLTPHIKDTNVYWGVVGKRIVGGERHQKGMAGCLTGNPLFDEKISIDNLMMKNLASQKFPQGSILASTQCKPKFLNAKSKYQNFCISYRGSGTKGAIFPQNNPFLLFRNLFGSALPSGTGETGATFPLDTKKAALNLAGEHYGYLKENLKNLSLSEKSLYEEMTDTTTSLWQGLKSGSRLDVGISAPTSDLESQLFNPNKVPEITKVQIDILAQALFMQLSRAVVFQLTASESQHIYNWVDYTYGNATKKVDLNQHFASHQSNAGDKSENEAVFTAIQKYHASVVAYIASKLSSYSSLSKNGSLLDDTVILWVSCLGNPRVHYHSPWPYLSVGGRNFMSTGNFFDFKKEKTEVSNQEMLTTLYRKLMPEESNQIIGTQEYFKKTFTGL